MRHEGAVWKVQAQEHVKGVSPGIGQDVEGQQAEEFGALEQQRGQHADAAEHHGGIDVERHDNPLEPIDDG